MNWYLFNQFIFDIFMQSLQIMKKIFTILLVLSAVILNAQTYRSTSSTISFFSDAPLEDIYAESKKSNSVLDATKKEVAILIKPNSFVFKNPMMQEHFNEDYMESAKFPKASFKGGIIGDFDVKTDGKYSVTVKGKLTIHGVTKDRDVKGEIVVKNGKVSVNTKFAVKVADHGIKIPSIQIKNIAEVVEVSINIEYKELPAKK